MKWFNGGRDMGDAGLRFFTERLMGGPVLPSELLSAAGSLSKNEVKQMFDEFGGPGNDRYLIYDGGDMVDLKVEADSEVDDDVCDMSLGKTSAPLCHSNAACVDYESDPLGGDGRIS